MANALLDVPATARRGEIVTLRIVLSHVMETGYRRDISANAIPRNIVRWFSCAYDGEEVFRCEMTQAIAANPFLGFTLVATRSGPIVLTWRDDEGVDYREAFALTVRE